MRSNRLVNKVAIVTGAGSGIGRGCALMFARHGAEVMATDLSESAMVETHRLAAEESLPIASVQPVDLTKPDHVQRLVDATIHRYGRLDVLVNAGAWAA